MTRADLFNMALKLGIKDDREKALHLLREELKKYFNSDEGMNYLQNSPRVYVEGNNNFPLQDNHINVIIDLLIKEVAGYEFS
jgi:hypothetical protein